MAEAVQVFKDNMHAADRLRAEQDQERAAKEARAAHMGELVASLERQGQQLCFKRAERLERVLGRRAR